MRPERAWVRLESGRRLNLLQPDPDSWTDRDLAIGLSRTYRWGGHSCWDLPLSVAQHSLLVLILRQKIAPLDRLTRGEALRELLHDADEGMLSFDPISPFKPHLGADYDSLVSRLRTAIETRYGIPAWDDESYAAHKRADRLAAASEALHVAGWSYQDLQDTLDIQTQPLTDDPLPQLVGLKPWEPWSARTAVALFLAKLHALMGSEDPEHAADLDACIAREPTIAEVATAFARLPPGDRLRCGRPPTGNSLTDTFVRVEAGDYSASIEGVIVVGELDEAGDWDFDAPFTVLTTDEELIVCRGDCYVDVL
jgi:hypothetical protein